MRKYPIRSYFTGGRKQSLQCIVQCGEKERILNIFFQWTVNRLLVMMMALSEARLLNLKQGKIFG